MLVKINGIVMIVKQTHRAHGDRYYFKDVAGTEISCKKSELEWMHNIPFQLWVKFLDEAQEITKLYKED